MLAAFVSSAILALAAGGPACDRCSRPVQAQPSASTLFNPPPSSYSPEQFVARTDWPSANSYYQAGQVIFFQERFYDNQGRFGNPNWTFRQFRTFRSGFGYR